MKKKTIFVAIIIIVAAMTIIYLEIPALITGNNSSLNLDGHDVLYTDNGKLIFKQYEVNEKEEIIYTTSKKERIIDGVILNNNIVFATLINIKGTEINKLSIFLYENNEIKKIFEYDNIFIGRFIGDGGEINRLDLNKVITGRFLEKLFIVGENKVALIYRYDDQWFNRNNKRYPTHGVIKAKILNFNNNQQENVDLLELRNRRQDSSSMDTFLSLGSNVKIGSSAREIFDKKNNFSSKDSTITLASHLSKLNDDEKFEEYYPTTDNYDFYSSYGIINCDINMNYGCKVGNQIPSTHLYSTYDNNIGIVNNVLVLNNETAIKFDRDTKLDLSMCHPMLCFWEWGIYITKIDLFSENKQRTLARFLNVGHALWVQDVTLSHNKKYAMFNFVKNNKVSYNYILDIENQNWTLIKKTNYQFEKNILFIK